VPVGIDHIKGRVSWLDTGGEVAPAGGDRERVFLIPLLTMTKKMHSLQFDILGRSKLGLNMGRKLCFRLAWETWRKLPSGVSSY